MDDSGHYSFFINNNEDKINLIESSRSGYIRIWDFDTGILLSKIKFEYKILDICEWDENLIFLGCEDNNIVLVNLFLGKIIKTLSGHINQVCCIKVLSNKKNGKFLISQCKGTDQIKLWKNKN